MYIYFFYSCQVVSLSVSLFVSSPMSPSTFRISLMMASVLMHGVFVGDGSAAFFVRHFKRNILAA